MTNLKKVSACLAGFLFMSAGANLVAGLGDSLSDWWNGTSATTDTKCKSGRDCKKDGKSKGYSGRSRISRHDHTGLEAQLMRLAKVCPGDDAAISSVSPTWVMLCSELGLGSKEDCAQMLRRYVDSDWLHPDDVASGKTPDKNYKEFRAAALVRLVIREARIAKLMRDLKAMPKDAAANVARQSSNASKASKCKKFGRNGKNCPATAPVANDPVPTDDMDMTPDM